MEFINGTMDGFIKEIFMKIYDMDMDSFILETRSYLEEYGNKVNKDNNNNSNQTLMNQDLVNFQ